MQIAKKLGPSAALPLKKRKRQRYASISSLRRSQEEHQTKYSDGEEVPMKNTVKGVGHALEEAPRANVAILH